MNRDAGVNLISTPGRLHAPKGFQRGPLKKGETGLQSVCRYWVGGSHPPGYGPMFLAKSRRDVWQLGSMEWQGDTWPMEVSSRGWLRHKVSCLWGGLVQTQEITIQVKGECDEGGRPGEATCFLPAQLTAQTPPLHSHLHPLIWTLFLSRNFEKEATLAPVIVSPIVLFNEHLLYAASWAVSKLPNHFAGSPQL